MGQPHWFALGDRVSASGAAVATMEPLSPRLRAMSGFTPPTVRTPAALLRQAEPLQQLFKQAQRLARLQQLLNNLLEPAAREHCQVASVNNGCLLLIISDAAWATRLRYRQHKLLQSLQGLKEFAGLSRMALKVCPKVNLNTPQSVATTAAPVLSVQAAASLREAAECISDGKLRAALERLASNAQRAPHQ